MRRRRRGTCRRASLNSERHAFNRNPRFAAATRTRLAPEQSDVARPVGTPDKISAVRNEEGSDARWLEKSVDRPVRRTCRRCFEPAAGVRQTQRGRRPARWGTVWLAQATRGGAAAAAFPVTVVPLERGGRIADRRRRRLRFVAAWLRTVRAAGRLDRFDFGDRRAAISLRKRAVGHQKQRNADHRRTGCQFMERLAPHGVLRWLARMGAS